MSPIASSSSLKNVWPKQSPRNVPFAASVARPSLKLWSAGGFIISLQIYTCKRRPAHTKAITAKPSTILPRRGGLHHSQGVPDGPQRTGLRRESFVCYGELFTIL